MPNSFKKVLLIFALIIIAAIVVVRMLPKPKLSFYEKQEFLKGVDQLNLDLPRSIGTIGRLDKVSFDINQLTYHITIYGDDSIDKFYEDNYDAIGELLKYSVIMLNGQRNMGNLFAKFIDDKGILLLVELSSPSKKKFRWNFTGKELFDFITSQNLNPTEALCLVIDTQIKFANIYLTQSISTNAIASSLSPNGRLTKIIYANNNIIFIYETNERETSISEIRDNLSNELFVEIFASLLSEDADCKEFMNMFVISHSDLTLRIKNEFATDSVDITIPYSVIKNYCNIQSKILL